MNKKRTDARALESFLEQRAGYEGGLDPQVEQLVGALEQWPHEKQLQSRAGFTQELAQRLQQQEQAARKPWSAWPLFSRVLAGVATAAAALLIFFLATTLFRSPAAGDPAEPIRQRPTPAALQGQAGLFAGVAFRLDAPLGDEAQQIPRYIVEPLPLPDTPEAVRAMALSLGLQEPRIYTLHGAVEGWTAHDGAGRRFTVDPNHVRFPLIYHAPAAQGEAAAALPFAEAARLAEEFLQQAELLPAGYELRGQPPTGGDAHTSVEIIPTLDGRPVHYASSEVVIGAGGAVVAARIQPLAFRPSGGAFTMRPARAAFDDVLASRVTIDGRRTTGLDGAAFPTFDAEQRGRPVTLIGYVVALQLVDEVGQEETVLVELFQGPEGMNGFQLVGPAAAGLQEETFATVRGVLQEQLPGGRWQVQVSEWEPLDVDNDLQCRQGELQQNGDDYLFVSGEGGPFTLAAAPDADVGQAVILCAGFSTADPAERLAWMRITPLTPSAGMAPELAAEAGAPEPLLLAGGALPDTLIVDWATPGYLYPPQTRESLSGLPLEPVWLFYTRSADGTTHLILRVPAGGDIESASPEQ